MVSITSRSLHVAAKAMAIADERDNTIPLFSSKPAEIKQDLPDVLSLEDIAWVDSCLIKDPDISQIDWNSWNSFRDVLNETLSFETESSAAGIENHPGVIHISSSSQEMGSPQVLGTGTDGDSSSTEATEQSSAGHLVSEHTDILHSEINLENVFLPTWNENLENFGVPDTVDGVDFPGFVMEQSTGDIFKVWDLGLPQEEGEFINQLNKALMHASVSRDAGPPKDLKDIAIDDIISGISDLSLNHFSN